MVPGTGAENDDRRRLRKVEMEGIRLKIELKNGGERRQRRRAGRRKKRQRTASEEKMAWLVSL